MDLETDTVAVVVPVYQGADSLPRLMNDLVAVGWPIAAAGRHLVLTEVVLVHDGAIDDSAQVIQALLEQYDFVEAVWLSRNFGQHPATVAGIASTSADWVVTMDEDGLHDPASIPSMYRRALSDKADLVYAVPDADPPHSWFRNVSSRLAKWAFRLLLGAAATETFTSFRLVDGVVARSLAAYYGADVYLDVALTWVVGKVAYENVSFRPEARGSEIGSGYDLRKLMSHFRRLVVTSGTRPLRLAAAGGVFAVFTGFGIAFVVALMRVFGDVSAQGWASLIISIWILGGLILLVLGVVAEYLSSALNMAQGRPPYLTLHRPPRSGGVRDSDA